MIEQENIDLAAGYVGATMLLCPLLALIGWKLSGTLLAST